MNDIIRTAFPPVIGQFGRNALLSSSPSSLSLFLSRLFCPSSTFQLSDAPHLHLNIQITIPATLWRRPRSLHNHNRPAKHQNNTNINNKQTSSANHSHASPHIPPCPPFAGASTARFSRSPAAAGQHTLRWLAISPQARAPSAAP